MSDAPPADPPAPLSPAVATIWLRLLAMPALCGEKARLLANALIPLAQHPLAAQQAALRTAGLNARQIGQYSALNGDLLNKSLRWLDTPAHHLIPCDDPRYPALLRETDDYPVALCVAGDPAALKRAQLAVVGSRDHSWYGERWGREFTHQLARHGLTITSGLALGIDSVAHQAALNANGHTLAVLGHGLWQIYPKRHQTLAKQILQQGGALISEFPLHTVPWPGNFPRRNRIISGLSLGVFVVEASLRSGSLVTARCALAQGKDVFALPGPVGNPGCEGTHWLIKQGAALVSHPHDIIEQLRLARGWLAQLHDIPAPVAENPPQSSSLAALLANTGDEVTAVDLIAERSGLAPAVVAGQLLELELAGLIAAVPGGYVRLRPLATPALPPLT